MFHRALELKTKLNERKVTLGTWITLSHTGIAEILGECHFDWLVIDMEHSVIELSEAQQLIQVISLSGGIPLVRMPDQSPTNIKRVMDAGAAGVLIPNVKTKAEAEAAVAAVKYPSLGSRGVGLARAQGYGMDFKNYEEWVNRGSIVILQIEHILGVKNLKEILSVSDVDAIIVGPYDLSGSIGKPGKLHDPDVERLINQIVEMASENGIAAGFHVVQPDLDEVEKRINQGFNFIGYSLDTIVLGNAFLNHTQALRNRVNKRSRTEAM